MTSLPPTERRTAAVVLSGGTAVRLDGADKASVEVDGRPLLELALDATAGCDETVVVGDARPTGRPVTFAREEPPGGGPAAALLAGLDALPGGADVVVVLAVDMPRVTAGTVARLVEALDGPDDRPGDGAGDEAADEAADGAVLVDDDGRRQPLCGAYRASSLRAAQPEARDDRHGLPVRRLLSAMRLHEVPAREDEARDVDTWADLAELCDLGKPGVS